MNIIESTLDKQLDILTNHLLKGHEIEALSGF